MDMPTEIVDKTACIVRSFIIHPDRIKPNYSAITLIQVQNKVIVCGDHGTGDTFISGK